MKLLLDTHALVWWIGGNTALRRSARDAIADDLNTVAVSAVSAMEVTTKYRLGKMDEAALLAHDFSDIVAEQGFVELSITVQHAKLAGAMNFAHGDPFDRLLIAQAQIEDMVLVSNEKLFDATGVQRLW